mgnify:CR=1 FL=1
MNSRYESKTTAFDSDANSIFSKIATKQMIRKERVKMLYSAADGITESSFTKLAGYRNNLEAVVQPQYKINYSTIPKPNANTELSK